MLRQYIRTSKLVRRVAEEYISSGRVPPRWSWKYLPEGMERKLALVSLRAGLHFFGFDTQDWTDRELEAAVDLFGRMVASTGVTVKQASEAFHNVGRLAGESMRSCLESVNDPKIKELRKQIQEGTISIEEAEIKAEELWLELGL